MVIQLEDKQINEIKKKLLKKVNLNKLNIDQKIKFTLDQKENIIKEFTFQLSNTEKIYLQEILRQKNLLKKQL